VLFSFAPQSSILHSRELYLGNGTDHAQRKDGDVLATERIGLDPLKPVDVAITGSCRHKETRSAARVVSLPIKITISSKDVEDYSDVAMMRPAALNDIYRSLAIPLVEQARSRSPGPFSDHQKKQLAGVSTSMLMKGHRAREGTFVRCIRCVAGVR
jgi:hypothetical protein